MVLRQRSNSVSTRGPRLTSGYRRYLLAAGAFASAVMLAACGSGGAGPSEGPTSPTATGGGEEVVEEDPAEFFRGKTITWIVPYGAGGGFDLSSRLIAPYLEDALDATIVIQNEPGAGGLLGLNNLSRAEPDGLTIGIMNGPGALTAAMAEIDAVQFDFDKIEKLARVGSSDYFLMTATDGPHDSIESILQGGTFRFASTGRGSTDFITAKVMLEALGLDGDVVTGFESAPEGHLAVVRGDVDGMTVGRSGATESHLRTGDAQMVLALEPEPFDDYPDVPTVLDLDLEDEQRSIIEAHLDVLAAYKVVVAPPGVPDARIAFLREKLEEILTDPAVQERSAESGEDIRFMSGAEIQELLDRIFTDAPEAYTRIVSESLQ